MTFPLLTRAQYLNVVTLVQDEWRTGDGASLVVAAAGARGQHQWTLAGATLRAFTKNSMQALRWLRTNTPAAAVLTWNTPTLYLTCVADGLEDVVRFVAEALDEITPEEHRIDADVSCRRQFLKDVKEFLNGKQTIGPDGRPYIAKPGLKQTFGDDNIQLSWPPGAGYIIVTVAGQAKARYGDILGAVQDRLQAIAPAIPLPPPANNHHARIAALKNSNPPAYCQPPDTAQKAQMLIAHYVMRLRDVTGIYGGFVRDTIVNGDTSNDIDV